MVKQVLLYVIILVVVGVGIWLFTRKGSTPTDLYSATTTPSASASPSASPTATPTPAKPINSTTLKDGLKIEDEVIGTGTAAKAGDSVSVQYTGWLTNGTKFDSSFDHGQAFTFLLGGGQVIKGWDEGVVGMKAGGKRRLTIPAALAYGNQSVANGLIPANSTLIFEVELVSIGK